MLSLGYNEERANRTANVQTSLMQATSQLARFTQGGSVSQGEVEDVLILAGTSRNPADVLMHDKIIMPEWEGFTAALASVSTRANVKIRLCLQNFDWSQNPRIASLFSLLEASIHHLVLVNNGNGAKFAINALEMKSTLGRLTLDNNRLDSDDAISFAQHASTHPNLHGITLRQCGPIGQDKAVMSSIVPLLLNSLRRVSLVDIGMGCYGAKLIAECLASNPANLGYLDLEDNLLSDYEAKLIAGSLATNDKLRVPGLARNRITEAVGVQSLAIAVWGSSPRLGHWQGHYEMNALHDANHACRVLLGTEYRLSNINTLDPRVNRSVKVFFALIPYNADYTNIRCFDGVTVALMPRVISILQGKGIGGVRFRPHSSPRNNRLNGVYQLLREWSMPLLYTSLGGPEPRRSDRIRRKKEAELMGK